MKKRLYEIAVVSRDKKDQDNELIIQPTPFMAADENAATAQGILLAATKVGTDFDPSYVEVHVRLFQ